MVLISNIIGVFFIVTVAFRFLLSKLFCMYPQTTLRAVFLFRWTLLVFVFWLVSMQEATHAEEAGSGHYAPGFLASAVDMTPINEAFVVRVKTLNYEGSLGNTKLPIAGLVVTEADIETSEVALELVWNPKGEFIDGWSYSMGATFPYVSMKVSAEIVDELDNIASVSRRVTSEESGFGDLIFQPLMLSHTIERYWWGDYRLAIYAPTGEYEIGRLANTGKNYWTLSPTLALIHIEPAIGREFSVFGGIDFNSNNSDIDYQTGIQAHVESTFVQNLILFGGFTGIGASGYWYRQLTGDSGRGAVLGKLKSEAFGIGPVLSYRTQWNNAEIFCELKWLHDIEASQRYEGDTISLKVSAEY
ncbi:hypothetical protein EDI28_15805 [Photobacterium chitinilyticum]|uniref:Transporter n=2 Tax=Photobacterium chitinilyticum TaxID=2485123 RepID=A0A3S3RGA8_9GAMM|nr:hypothetical protein EDI28_15805 [Photobacterium chitinilyticum]